MEDALFELIRRGGTWKTQQQDTLKFEMLVLLVNWKVMNIRKLFSLSK
jgi:hypothetical protein